MKKLNQAQQQKVETAKAEIIKLQEAQNVIYSNLVDEIKEDNDWLYDYIFNCPLDDAYSLRVKEEIFEK